MFTFKLHCLIIDHEVKSDLNIILLEIKQIHMKFWTTNHHTNT